MRRVTSRTNRIDLNALPEPDAAVQIYEQRYHGRLTDPHTFGTDPLNDNQELKNLRSRHFVNNHNVEMIFADLVNGRNFTLRNAILFFINETRRLSTKIIC